MNDFISRQAAIDAANDWLLDCFKVEKQDRSCGLIRRLEDLPPAQPFHNTTMNEVLKYIDDMPEDVWQEFTACLECRGWELQRRTAKWCGGDFV